MFVDVQCPWCDTHWAPREASTMSRSIATQPWFVPYPVGGVPPPTSSSFGQPETPLMQALRDLRRVEELLEKQG